MKDITLVNHLNSLSGSSPEKTEKTAAGFADTLSKIIKETEKTAAGFADTLSKIIKETNEQQMAADRAIEKLNTGEGKNIHDVMISMEKADISMRLLVQMRNKIVEAYQEIMRMQV